jgi:hypothetical protein
MAAAVSVGSGLPASFGGRKGQFSCEHPPTPIPVNANSVNSRKLGTRFTGSGGGLASGCAPARLPFISSSGELLTPLAVSVGCDLCHQRDEPMTGQARGAPQIRHATDYGDGQAELCPLRDGTVKKNEPQLFTAASPRCNSLSLACSRPSRTGLALAVVSLRSSRGGVFAGHSPARRHPPTTLRATEPRSFRLRHLWGGRGLPSAARRAHPVLAQAHCGRLAGTGRITEVRRAAAIERVRRIIHR